MTSTRRRRWWVAGGVLAVQAVGLAASCSTPLGEQDCMRLADAVGAVKQYTCDGGDAGFAEGYAETLKWVANGNCSNITSVNDQGAFEECLSCLADASCYDGGGLCGGELDAGTRSMLPEGCAYQLSF